MPISLRGGLTLAAVVLLILAVPLLVVSFAAKSSMWMDLTVWIYGQQKDWQRSISGSLEALSGGFGISAAWALITASFLYGFFHAVGPGHGKVIMTTFLLANPQEVKRGMTLSVIAALCQGIVAIVLVYGLLFVAGFVATETRSTLLWSERLSYILVALMGLWLIWRAVKSFMSAKGKDACEYGHQHGPDCGHNHGVGPEQLAQGTSLKASMGIVLSIGLRPCTGAVLVLVLAKSLGLALVGAVAVFAMSLGTAIAITSLALLTIWSRSIASRWIDHRFSSAWSWLSPAISVVGGLLLVSIGWILLMGTFATRSALGIS